MRETAAMIAVLAALALSGAPAQGAMQALEQAWEVPLGAVTLPGNESGQLVVRRCTSCKPDVLRVNAATRYFVRPSRAPVAFAELRRAAVKAGANRAALMYVYYDPASRTVRRLVVDAGATPAGKPR
jgi:hypothetical protein